MGGGLNRFDRSTGQFVRFNHNPSNPRSLSHDHLRTIIEDGRGALWIGTDGGGLNKMDARTERFPKLQAQRRRPHEASEMNRVRVVYEDRDGAIWVGTLGAGLSRFDDRSTIVSSIFDTRPMTRRACRTTAYARFIKTPRARSGSPPTEDSPSGVPRSSRSSGTDTTQRTPSA